MARVLLDLSGPVAQWAYAQKMFGAIDVNNIRNLAASIAVFAGVAVCAPAHSMVQYTLISGSCPASGSSTTTGNTCSYGDGSGGSITSTAWANTGGFPDSTLESAVMQQSIFNPDGSGVRWVDGGSAESGSSPHHAMDNNGNIEMMLFDLGGQFTMTHVDLAWVGFDSDISILAYTGADPFDANTKVGTQTVTDSTETLTSEGWEVVANISNTSVGLNDFSASSAGTVSRYWLVSAFAQSFGPSWTAGNDAVKVRGVKGIFDTTDGGTEVALPATLLMLAAVLPFIRRRVT